MSYQLKIIFRSETILSFVKEWEKAQTFCANISAQLQK
jgi:hypothetical protein